MKNYCFILSVKMGNIIFYLNATPSEKFDDAFVILRTPLSARYSAVRGG